MSVTGGDPNAMVVGLTLDADQFLSGMRAASDAFVLFNGSVERSLSALGRMGLAAAPILAISAALVTGVTAAAALEQQIANLNAAMQLTPALMQQVTAQALDLSRATQFNAAQIIQAEAPLGRAGATASDLKVETPQVLNLASAAMIDPTQASRLFVAAQKDFQLSAKDSIQIANDLAQALDSSTLTAPQFAQAWKQLGPVAASNNQDLKDTAAVIATLSQAGLTGDAGTALKTFIQRIATETPAARAEIQALGLEFYDASGRLKSYAEIADQIRTKTIGMTEEQTQQALGTIFGTRGVRVADIFAEQGSSGITDTIAHMNELGDSAAIQAKKLDTLQGQAHILASSLNVLGVELGNDVLPGLRELTNLGKDTTNWLSNIPAPIQSAAVGAAAIVGINRFAQGRQQRATDKQTAAAAPGIAADNQAYNAFSAQQGADYDAYVQHEIALQQQLRDARFQAQAYQTTVGIADPAGAARITALEEELDLLRTKGALEADIFAAEAKAIAEGSARIQSEIGQLNEETAVIERQIAARQALNMQTNGLQGDLAEFQSRSTFLQSGGDLAGYEAYKRDFTIYEQEMQQQLAAAKAAGLRNVSMKTPPPVIQDYAPVAPAFAPVADVNRMGPFEAPPGTLASGGYPVPVTVGAAAVDTTGLVAGAKGKIGTALASAGALMGEFFLPVTIALTAQQLIVDPALDALAKKRAQSLTGTYDQTTFGMDPAQLRANAEAYLAQQQQALADAQQAQSHLGGPLSGALNGYQKTIGRFDIGNHFAGQFTSDSTQGFQAEIDQTKAFIKQLDDTRQQAPALVRQTINDYTTALVGAIQSGNIDAKGATTQFNDTIDHYLAVANRFMPNGVRPDLMQIINQARPDFGKTAIDAQKQFQQQQVQQQIQDDADQQRLADLRKEAQATDTPLPDDATVLTGIQGTNKTAVDEIKDVDEAYKKLTTDLNTLGTTVGKIDLAKGLDTLGSAAPGLERSVAALAKLGVSSNTLNSLTTLADGFKGIQDATDRATASFDAYMMTLSDSDDRLKSLDGIKKQFQDEINYIAQKQANGQALTPAEQQIAQNGLNILGNINDQQQQIQSNKGDDLLGIAKNMPDFVTLDGMERRWVADMGGNLSLFDRSKTDLDSIQKQLLDITDGTYTVTIDFVNKGGQPIAGPTANSGGTVSAPLGPPLPTGYQDPSPGNTTQGGSVPVAAAAASTGNPLAYRTLDYGQYAAIVEDASKNSPFENPQIYQAVQAAAQQYNIDPRALLSFTKYENNDATNASNSLLNVNNFGGIKYTQGNPYETQGPESSEGDSYAAFKSPTDFFKVLAANLTTGDYAGDFANGDLTAIRKRYVAGDAAPSNDQQQNIQETIADYLKYIAFFPGAQGGVTGGGGPQTSPLRSPDGGGTGSNGDDALRQQIVSAARTFIGSDQFANLCEQFAETVVQGATGVRGATGVKEADATSAFKDAQSMGLVTKNPQSGDLVYYPDPNGGAGHVAIYVGNGQQVSTYDGRPTPNGDPNAIHLESVAPGAQYVRSVGGGDPFFSSGPLAGIAALTNTTDATQHPPYVYQPPVNGADFAAQYGAGMRALSPDNQKLAAQGFDQTFALDQGVNAKIYGPGAKADQESIRQAGAAYQAWLPALTDIQNHTAVTAEHMQAIRDTGGPIGAALIQQAQITQQIADANEKLKQDQADLKSGEEGQATVQKDRAAADKRTALDRKNDDLATQHAATVAERKDTTDEWAVQDLRTKAQDGWQQAQRRFAAATDAENDLWTTKDRTYQDEIRTIDHLGTTRQRQLQDEMTALDRGHQTALNHTAANEQILIAQSKMATATGQPSTASVQLAIERGGAKLQKDLFDQQKADLQDQITLQQRDAADKKFDIETTHIADQRAHEDKIKGIADEQKAEQITEQNAQRKWQAEDTALQRQRTLIQWQQEDARNQTQLTRDAIDQQTADQRQKQDDLYQDWLKQQNDKIAKDQENTTALKDQQAAIGAIEQFVEKMFPLIGEGVQKFVDAIWPLVGVGNLATATTAAPTIAGGKGDTPIPHHAAGTASAPAGLAVVGEGPEVVNFGGGEAVYNQQQLRDLFGIHNVTPITAAPSWQGDVHINVAGGGLDETAMGNITTYVKQEIKESERRTSATVGRRAGGAMRG